MLKSKKKITIKARDIESKHQRTETSELSNKVCTNKPKFILLSNPQLTFTIKTPQYSFPRIMSTHKCKLIAIERNVEERKELEDEFEDIKYNDMHIVKKIKDFFKYGNVDKTLLHNTYIENLMNYFYAKKENIINFAYDIYAAPYLKNNLLFEANFWDSINNNRYKLTIDKIKDFLNTNAMFILNRATYLRLNKLKKLNLVVQDYKTLSEVKETENHDFGDYAYLNNKNEKYQGINIATGPEREIILYQSYLFNKPKTALEQNSKIKNKNKNNQNIFNILIQHQQEHTNNNMIELSNNDDIIEFLIRRHIRNMNINSSFKREK